MEPSRAELRDRLLGQQEVPPNLLAQYRKDVDLMVEEIRRRKWWVDLVQAVLVTVGSLVLFFVSAFSWLVAFLLLAKQGVTPAEVAIPAVVGISALLGVIILLRYYFRRGKSEDVLLELKRIQLQLLELQDRAKLNVDR